MFWHRRIPYKVKKTHGQARLIGIPKYSMSGKEKKQDKAKVIKKVEIYTKICFKTTSDTQFKLQNIGYFL